MNRFAFAMLLTLVGWSVPSEARTLTGESRRLRLSAVYDVAPGCMNAATFLHKLSEHIAAGGGNDLKSYVVVYYDDDKQQYAAAMTFNGSEPLVLRGSNCNELLEDAILEAGMARTNIAPKNREDKGHVIDFMTRAGRLEPRAPLTLVAPNTLSVAKAPPPAAKPPAPSPSATSPQDAVEEVGKTSPGFQLASHLQMAQGVLPRPAWGTGLSAAMQWGGTLWRLDTTVWQTQRWKPWNEPRFPDSSLTLLSAGLSACSQLLQLPMRGSPIRLNACIRAGLSRLVANASKTFGGASVDNRQIGTRLGLAWYLNPLVIRLFGRVDSVFRGPALGLDSSITAEGSPRDNAFRMASAVSTVGLQIGWNFEALSGDATVRN